MLKFGLLNKRGTTGSLFFLTLSLGLLIAPLFPASAQSKGEFGTLKCDVEGGINFVIGTTKNLHCIFHKTHGRTSAYVGKINKFGLSLGATAGGVIVWTVLGSTSALPKNELAGTYLGVSGDIAVGLGVGANALIGGSEKTVILQPFSVEGEVGFDLTLAVAGLSLRPLFKTAAVRQMVFEEVDVEVHYGCGSYVIVESGDTLSEVAKECGVTVDAILGANVEIENVRELRIGERIKIPAQTGQHSKSPCGEKEILQPSEKLVSLAQRCGVTMHALIVANPEFKNLEEIKSGLVINIPSYQ